MDPKQKHKQLIGKPPDGFAHLGFQFSASERQYLARYGAWMEALQSGSLEPLTAAQLNFVRAVTGETTPTTYAEVLWDKWKKHHTPWKRKLEAATDLSMNRRAPAASHYSSLSEARIAEFALPWVCNACGSNSPNLCRCSQ